MPEQLAPRCARCGRPHRVDLPCWRGRYAQQRREDAFRYHGRQCVLCRVEGCRTRATHIDHDIPRALGGGDEMSNLQPLCPTHNLAKGKRKYQPPPTPPIAGNGEPVSPRFR